MRRAAGDLAELQTLALDFWEAIVRASENVAYRLAYNSMRRTYDRCRDLLKSVLADELGDVASYELIAGAIRQSDAVAAEATARNLIRRGERAIEDALEQLEKARRKAS
jgi:DNA-binding FadR family transcriptional regulator